MRSYWPLIAAPPPACLLAPQVEYVKCVVMPLAAQCAVRRDLRLKDCFVAFSSAAFTAELGGEPQPAQRPPMLLFRQIADRQTLLFRL